MKFSFTGNSFLVDGFEISRRTTYDGFLASGLYKTAQLQGVPPEMRHARLAAVPIDAHEELLISLEFQGQNLQSIVMTMSAEKFGKSWEEWSVEKEEHRKKANETFAAEQGFPVGQHPWGLVQSAYDSVGGGNSFLKISFI